MDVKTNQQLAFCVGWVNGKHYKNPFKKRDPKKIFTILLELVHIDLCGSMKMTLIEGAWFLMIFTNENTKVVWTHFLKSKSKSLATFKEFQAMVETNSRKKIKCIWNDNGNEFISKAFKGNCKAKGIQ
jgi:hypothetical protein